MGPAKDTVADGVARPIDPRRLAEPQTDNAVVPGVAVALGELATHDRRGGQFFVETRLEHEREIPLHQRLSGGQLLVQAGERGTGIAGGECRGSQSVGAVDP